MPTIKEIAIAIGATYLFLLAGAFIIATLTGQGYGALIFWPFN